MISEKEFMSRYFDIKQRLAAEEIQHPLDWPNEDWSKLIYGTEDEKTRRMMSDLASDMEDTGGMDCQGAIQGFPGRHRNGGDRRLWSMENRFSEPAVCFPES